MNFLIDYPDYDVDKEGNVYKNGNIIKPFKSNKYLQVLIFDKNHNRRVCGVHTLVATKYIDNYYEGCVVHHKNHNTHDNRVQNLEILSRSLHSRLHGKNNTSLSNYIKINGPWNKGKRMSEEAKKHLSEKRKEMFKNKEIKFNGNQHVNRNKIHIIQPIYFDNQNIKIGRNK